MDSADAFRALASDRLARLAQEERDKVRGYKLDTALPLILRFRGICRAEAYEMASLAVMATPCSDEERAHLNADDAA